ncbi:DsbA family protein [Fretibacter rubidus]|uniref:DsbA family oxidoreductase n=1 Tax=Fretibacter rubidus TaxID=570162 RepID=UPI00352A8538
MSAGPKPLEVDIVSDIVCPWCWVGLRYFLQAKDYMPFAITLNWHPYMLDPHVPQGGVPYSDYMKAKFGDGPSDKFKAMRAHLEEIGPQLGIDFQFSSIPMRPNTLNAHRVIRWASGQGLGTEMAEALFKAFFTDQRDVGDTAVLADLAGNVGLDKTLTAELLSTERDKAEVSADITHFQTLGISGVPTFIYNRQYAVQGAQPAQHHANALRQAVQNIAQT